MVEASWFMTIAMPVVFCTLGYSIGFEALAPKNGFEWGFYTVLGLAYVVYLTTAIRSLISLLIRGGD